MNQPTRKSIAKIADWVIDYFEIPIPITDIDAVVEKMGGRIEEIEATGSADIIQANDESGFSFVVSIPQYTSENKRNFAISHELGHLFLHMGYMSNQALWESYDPNASLIGSSHEDFEAHEFAAAFMMPKQKFYDYVYEHKVGNAVSTREISLYFKAPLDEVVSRGKWLEVLVWR